MKLITVNGKDFIIEKHKENWYARVEDCLIIKPTIREIKSDISEILNNK